MTVPADDAMMTVQMPRSDSAAIRAAPALGAVDVVMADKNDMKSWAQYCTSRVAGRHPAGSCSSGPERRILASPRDLTGRVMTSPNAAAVPAAVGYSPHSDRDDASAPP